MDAPGQKSDEELLIAAQMGRLTKNAVFKELFKRHAGWLLLKVSTWNRLEAADICQEAWLRVFQNISKLEPRNFRGWLGTIAHNLSQDEYRKKKPAQVDLETTVTQDHHPDVADGERKAVLRQCMENLRKTNPGFAEVIRRWSRGEAGQSIADGLGVAIGTVHSRVARALRFLRECVERAGL
jgi:RNA polymerase sigma factor (sigma-70 family)